MLWVIYWCPEEDVVLSRLSLYCSRLEIAQNSEVVLKAVPFMYNLKAIICALCQDLRLALRNQRPFRNG